MATPVLAIAQLATEIEPEGQAGRAHLRARSVYVSVGRAQARAPVERAIQAAGEQQQANRRADQRCQEK